MGRTRGAVGAVRGRGVAVGAVRGRGVAVGAVRGRGVAVGAVRGRGGRLERLGAGGGQLEWLRVVPTNQPTNNHGMRGAAEAGEKGRREQPG